MAGMDRRKFLRGIFPGAGGVLAGRQKEFQIYIKER